MTLRLLFSLILIFVQVLVKGQKIVDLRLIYNIKASSNTEKVEFITLIPNTIQDKQEVLQIDYSVKPLRVEEINDIKYATFLLTKPIQRNKKIIINIKVKIFKPEISIPKKLLDKSLDIDIEPFIKPEQYIQSQNKYIIAQAKKLKGKNLYLTLKGIFNYVNSSIKYSGYNPSNVGALKTLKRKHGDCTEFSDLFVALCRANGIPARTVNGITITASNTPKHTWTEVYINNQGWIPFDPTPGNHSTFKSMDNKYIIFSNQRNNKKLNYYFMWKYSYWGGDVSISDKIIIK